MLSYVIVLTTAPVMIQTWLFSISDNGHVVTQHTWNAPHFRHPIFPYSMVSQSTHFTQAFVGSRKGERNCNQIVWDNVSGFPDSVLADPLKDLDEIMLVSGSVGFGDLLPCIDIQYYAGKTIIREAVVVFVLCVPTRQFYFLIV